MDDNLKLFKKLPKMTNNHVHIVAMYPVIKLINFIKKHDQDLYDMLYILNSDMYENKCMHRYTIYLFDPLEKGVRFDDMTKETDWIKLDDIGIDLLVQYYKLDRKSPDAWKEFEIIQSRIRFFIRNVKVYYYLWYLTIRNNYRNGIYYLNVRSKPGAISKAVQRGTRLFVSSKNVVCIDEFSRRLHDINPNIKTNNYDYFYRTYERIKKESDIIVLALSDFNRTKQKPNYIDVESLEHMQLNQLANFYKSSPIPDSMVQYVITFPKPDKNKPADLTALGKEVEMYAIIGVIINIDYGFQFFNGIDFVGNENTTSDQILFASVSQLSYLEKYGFKIIPHLGESVIQRSENPGDSQISKINKLISHGIHRFGHGISISINEHNILISQREEIFIEFCPISNEIFGYYPVKANPHRKQIGNNKIRLMICSDDNGIFGYSNVSRDYLRLYKIWDMGWTQIKDFIINGMKGGIPEKYIDYYTMIFNDKWEKFLNKYEIKIDK